MTRDARSSNKAFASLSLILLMMSAGFLGVQGQASGCGITFFTSLIQLIPCRPAVIPFSPIPPSEACCTALRALGQACLCVLINGPPITGIDHNMAVQLPERCGANFEACSIMN